MQANIRRTAIYLIALAVIFAVVVPLTSHWTPGQKGLLHGGISFLFFFLIFFVWSSFRQVSWQKLAWTIGILLAMGLILPWAIDLASPLPTILKGLLHLIVVAAFLVGIIYVWRDPLKWR